MVDTSTVFKNKDVHSNFLMLTQISPCVRRRCWMLDPGRCLWSADEDTEQHRTNEQSPFRIFYTITTNQRPNFTSDIEQCRFSVSELSCGLACLELSPYFRILLGWIRLCWSLEVIPEIPALFLIFPAWPHTNYTPVVAVLLSRPLQTFPATATEKSAREQWQA